MKFRVDGNRLKKLLQQKTESHAGQAVHQEGAEALQRGRPSGFQPGTRTTVAFSLPPTLITAAQAACKGIRRNTEL